MCIRDRRTRLQRGRCGRIQKRRRKFQACDWLKKWRLFQSKEDHNLGIFQCGDFLNLREEEGASKSLLPKGTEQLRAHVDSGSVKANIVFLMDVPLGNRDVLRVQASPAFEVRLPAIVMPSKLQRRQRTQSQKNKVETKHMKNNPLVTMSFIALALGGWAPTSANAQLSVASPFTLTTPSYSRACRCRFGAMRILQQT